MGKLLGYRQMHLREKLEAIRNKGSLQKTTKAATVQSNKKNNALCTSTTL